MDYNYNNIMNIQQTLLNQGWQNNFKSSITTKFETILILEYINIFSFILYLFKVT